MPQIEKRQQQRSRQLDHAPGTGQLRGAVPRGPPVASPVAMEEGIRSPAFSRSTSAGEQAFVDEARQEVKVCLVCAFATSAAG